MVNSATLLGALTVIPLGTILKKSLQTKPSRDGYYGVSAALEFSCPVQLNCHVCIHRSSIPPPNGSGTDRVSVDKTVQEVLPISIDPPLPPSEAEKAPEMAPSVSETIQ